MASDLGWEALAFLVLIAIGMAAFLVLAARADRADKDRAQQHAGAFFVRMRLVRALMDAWNGPPRLTDQRRNPDEPR